DRGFVDRIAAVARASVRCEIFAVVGGVNYHGSIWQRAVEIELAEKCVCSKEQCIIVGIGYSIVSFRGRRFPLAREFIDRLPNGVLLRIVLFVKEMNAALIDEDEVAGRAFEDAFYLLRKEKVNVPLLQTI